MGDSVAKGPQSVSRRDRRTPSIAWRPTRELDLREWASAGRRIGSVGRSIQWLLGDWLAYGSSRFGERYARAAKISGYDVQTLMNMVYVASRFPISRRREKLSWSHHEAVAAQEVEDQEYWLSQAIAHRWSVSDLRVALRSTRQRGDANQNDEKLAVRERSGLSEPDLRVKCPRCGELVFVPL